MKQLNRPRVQDRLPKSCVAYKKRDLVNDDIVQFAQFFAIHIEKILLRNVFSVYKMTSWLVELFIVPTNKSISQINFVFGGYMTFETGNWTHLSLFYKYWIEWVGYRFDCITLKAIGFPWSQKYFYLGVLFYVKNLSY